MAQHSHAKKRHLHGHTEEEMSRHQQLSGRSKKRKLEQQYEGRSLNINLSACKYDFYIGLWFMVFNATFNNMSIILWRSLVKETGVP